MTAAFLALHLADNVHTIASTENAGQCFNDVRHAIDTIERVINRPLPKRFLGPCPEEIGPTRCRIKDPHQHPHACATEIQADFDASEAICPQCKTVHRVDALVERLRNDLEFFPMTATELLGRRASELPGALEQLNEPVARATFYRWCSSGWLTPRAYRGRCGTVRTERQDDTDQPMYWLADIRDLIHGHTQPTRQKRNA